MFIVGMLALWNCAIIIIVIVIAEKSLSSDQLEISSLGLLNLLGDRETWKVHKMWPRFLNSSYSLQSMRQPAKV